MAEPALKLPVTGMAPAGRPASNVAEFSVSELSSAIKKALGLGS